MRTRTDILAEGADILAPLMIENGFSFSIDAEGHSSGGDFAQGAWRKGNRKLELHFRFSLGLVGYYVGEAGVGHEGYVWAVTGKRRAGRYPGSSTEPLDAFRHLKDDIEEHCSVFLRGTDQELIEIIKKAHDLYRWWQSLPPLKRLEVP